MNATALPARPASSERTLTEHLGLVHHVARQLHRGLAAEADFDELVSAGAMGLMGALGSFDPSRGLAFSTYAAPRIRGAILDELRRQDHVPRSVRRKTRDITAAREALERDLGRAPRDAEVAKHLGMDLATYWRWREEVEGTVPLPLDRRAGDDREGRWSPLEVLAGETHLDIEERIDRDEEAALLRAAILRLKEQERVVLALYYFEELKLSQIAAVLELTESRISQIRSAAVARLREELRPMREKAA